MPILVFPKSGGRILLSNMFRPSAQYSYKIRLNEINEQNICPKNLIILELRINLR
jgi:hypothetical protein